MLLREDKRLFVGQTHQAVVFGIMRYSRVSDNLDSSIQKMSCAVRVWKPSVQRFALHTTKNRVWCSGTFLNDRKGWLSV